MSLAGTHAKDLLLGALAGVVFLLLPQAQATAAELIMFDSAGCPWCERWTAEVGPGYAKSSEGRRAPLRRVAFGTKLAGVALSKPVNATPTFVLVDQGREVGRITGYPGPDFFWGMLAELLAKVPHD
jgi:hypothetical protein